MLARTRVQFVTVILLVKQKCVRFKHVQFELITRIQYLHTLSWRPLPIIAKSVLFPHTKHVICSKLQQFVHIDFQGNADPREVCFVPDETDLFIYFFNKFSSFSVFRIVSHFLLIPTSIIIRLVFLCLRFKQISTVTLIS